MVMYLYISILLSLFLCASARGATNTAVSASLADVLAAYTNCVDGDTLSIPAGTNTWTGSLDIAKGIHVVGAGTNATRILASGSVRCFDIGTSQPNDPANNKTIRVSHLTISNAYYGINLAFTATTNTGLNDLRIDHCRFESCYAGVNQMQGTRVYGVVDHNTFFNCDFGVQLAGGAEIWKLPILAGTTNTLVIEANLFHADNNRSSANNYGNNEQIGSGHGVRYVVRNNVFDMASQTAAHCFPMENHGFAGLDGVDMYGSALRGPPLIEVYSNTISTYQVEDHGSYYCRGGSLLFFGNTMTTAAGEPYSITFTDDLTGDAGATWPNWDAVANSFVWGNTINGTNAVPYCQVQKATNTVILGRDYFTNAPASSGTRIVYNGYPGGLDVTTQSGVQQAYYPYTPLTYPHPLVTAQDGSGGSYDPQPPAGTNTTNGITVRVKNVRAGRIKKP